MPECKRTQRRNYRRIKNMQRNNGLTDAAWPGYWERREQAQVAMLREVSSFATAVLKDAFAAASRDRETWRERAGRLIKKYIKPMGERYGHRGWIGQLRGVR